MNLVCPLCRSVGFAGWRFGLMRCEHCGLVVDSTVWQIAANQQLNESFFGSAYQPVRSFWVRVFERMNNRRTVRRLRQAARPLEESSLLEVGVGSGSFLAYAKSRGVLPRGCELSPAICQHVEHVSGIAIHCGTVETMPEGEAYDLVVMNHVLEHVNDPVALLRAIRARMRRGGVLHLAVPNVAAWEAHLPGWAGYEPYHLLYFTPHTLMTAAETAGFEIQQIICRDSFSGWFLALVRSLARTGNAQRIGEESSGTPAISAALEHGYRLTMIVFGLATFPFRLFQDWFGKGDELILLAGYGHDE